MNDGIKALLLHLAQVRGYSPHTLDAYRRDLSVFARFAHDHDIALPHAAVPADIERFIGQQRRLGRSATTVGRRLSAIRRYFEFEKSRGQIAINPAAAIRAPRKVRKLPEVIDPEWLGVLLDFVPETRLEYRDKALLELLYGAGLRLSEVHALNWSALETSDQTVRVDGKGRKTRIVPIGRSAWAALKAWRRQQGLYEGPIFTGRGGARLSRRSIQQRVKVWARRRGLPQHLYPHLLRHCFASHILESSGDLRAVQELLGHSNLATTEIYTHLDFQRLAKVYDQAHPRARKDP